MQRQEGCIYPETEHDQFHSCAFCMHVFIVYPRCVFSAKPRRRRKRFPQQIFEISIKHSTQTYDSGTREKPLTTASHSISRFMSRPHIIIVNLSRHRLATRRFKVQSKCIYAFDPISLPLYHVAAGLLGSLSVGSNLRPQIEA